MPLRLLGLGDNTIDTYVDRGEQYPGGNAVNVAVLARRMGVQAAYCGCLGNDAGADILRAALAAENVDISHCRTCDAPNARAFIAHENGDRRFIRSEPGCRAAWGSFTPGDEAYFADFECVHSSIFSGLEAARDQLRAVIRIWSFDFSEKWTRENLAQWLPSLDYVFLSYPQGTDQETQELARHCASYGPQCIVITRGIRAALAWRAGRASWRTPEPIVPVDTLGAGDGLIAGFLVAALQGRPDDDALAQGMARAADVCGRSGAFGYGQPWNDPAAAAMQ